MTDQEQKLQRRAVRAIAAELQNVRIDEDTSDRRIDEIATRVLDAILAARLTIADAS